MAEIRPALVQAGFGIPEEFHVEFYVPDYGMYSDMNAPIDNNTREIANLLWELRAFPDVLEQVKFELLQTSIPVSIRLSKLNAIYAEMLKALDGIKEGYPHLAYNMGFAESLQYWNYGPRDC